MNTVIIIAICAAVVGTNIATIFYVHRLDATTKAEAEDLVEQAAMKTDVDHLYEKIAIIHGRIANLEKRIEPIGFQEVLTKHADEIAAICCREYDKLFQNGHDERGNADNNW